MNNVLNKLRRSQPVTIVVVGDSNTIVSMNTRGHMNWVDYLTEALWERYGDGLVTMINVSQCGFTFVRLAAEIEPKVLRWKPDLVITQLWLAGQGDHYSSCKGALHDCVAGIRAANPGADVLVCTPNPQVLCPGHHLPDGVAAGEVYENEFWNSERKADLLALAKAENCAVVDHFRAWKEKRYHFAHPGANPRGLWQRMIDPVHPNALGHLVLFRELAATFDVADRFQWEE